jgi:hypothetical protein
MGTPNSSGRDAINSAIELIGHNPHNNRHLEAYDGGRAHVGRLKSDPRAAPLLRILTSPPLQEVFRCYEEYDRAALKSQQRYKLVSFLLLAPLTVAVAVGLLGFGIPTAEVARGLARLGAGEPEVAARLWPTWTIYVLLLLTPLLGLTIRPLKQYEVWKRSRGTAEALRRELFERVIGTPGEAGKGELSPLLLKLEYFRRYQIEIQLAYHKTRGREHEVAARGGRILQAAFVIALLIWVLVSVGASLSGLTEQGALGGPQLLSFRVLEITKYMQNLEIYDIDYLLLGGSVLIALLYGAVFLSITLSASLRNAPRYRIMRDNFRQLTTELDAVREAASDQNEAAVRAFVGRVHSVMSGELADWVRLGDLDCGKENLSQSTAQRASAAATSSPTT